MPKVKAADAGMESGSLAFGRNPQVPNWMPFVLSV